MPVTAKLFREFYDRFGDKLVDELVGPLNDVDATFKAELAAQNDRNLALFDAKLEQRLAELKAELVKWMFLYLARHGRHHARPWEGATRGLILSRCRSE